MDVCGTCRSKFDERLNLDICPKCGRYICANDDEDLLDFSDEEHI
jgi:rRNA maturation endonuclease Nob1